MAVALYYLAHGHAVKNYDLEPITYFDPIRNRQRKYYPDFIIDDKIICEVKWIGFVFKKKHEEIKSKKAALQSFCEASGKYENVFMTNNDISKKFLDLAVEIHREKNEQSRRAKKS